MDITNHVLYLPMLEWGFMFLTGCQAIVKFCPYVQLCQVSRVLNMMVWPELNHLDNESDLYFLLKLMRLDNYCGLVHTPFCVLFLMSFAHTPFCVTSMVFEISKRKHKRGGWQRQCVCWRLFKNTKRGGWLWLLLQ